MRYNFSKNDDGKAKEGDVLFFINVGQGGEGGQPQQNRQSLFGCKSNSSTCAAVAAAPPTTNDIEEHGDIGATKRQELVNIVASVLELLSEGSEAREGPRG